MYHFLSGEDFIRPFPIHNKITNFFQVLVLPAVLYSHADLRKLGNAARFNWCKIQCFLSCVYAQQILMFDKG